MSMGAFDLSIMSWVLQGRRTDIIPTWIFSWHPKRKVERSSVQIGKFIVYTIYDTPAIVDES